MASAASAQPEATPAVKPFTHWLFDNDGVNIDSETAAMRVMDTEGVALVERYVANHGMEQDHIYRTYPGTSTDKIVLALIKKFDLPVDQIKADYGIKADATTEEVSIAIADDITIKTIEHFKVHLTAIPGVTEALTEIRATYGGDNVALCTTSREDRMDVSLEYAGDPDVEGWNANLGNLFPKGERRISGYDVANKYDMGFERLGDKGFKPETTVVVEDSKSGVSKARQGRPEVRVIGTAAAQFFEDKPAQAKVLFDAGAAVVLTHMGDLPKVGAWLNEGLDPAKKPEFKGTVYVPADFTAPALDPNAPGASIK
jgi:beta-phosphoglucomutase-like phosphatase (HAD superfamily)